MSMEIRGERMKMRYRIADAKEEIEEVLIRRFKGHRHEEIVLVLAQLSADWSRYLLEHLMEEQKK